MTEVRIPKVGMSTLDVEITDILVKVGQVVAATDVIFAVAADKIDLDIEAGVAGTVTEILVSEGDVIDVGQVVAHIDPS
jgi:pyruvate/2-oxoglutarate dehydrogenase complex dihydrolipoamide acyltransferase (E2) component